MNQKRKKSSQKNQKNPILLPLWLWIQIVLNAGVLLILLFTQMYPVVLRSVLGIAILLDVLFLSQALRYQKVGVYGNITLTFVGIFGNYALGSTLMTSIAFGLIPILITIILVKPHWRRFV